MAIRTFPDLELTQCYTVNEVLDEEDGAPAFCGELIGELTGTRLRGLMPDVHVDGKRRIKRIVPDSWIEQGLQQTRLAGSGQAGEPDDSARRRK
jgi:hypothetical protein